MVGSLGKSAFAVSQPLFQSSRCHGTVHQRPWWISSSLEGPWCGLVVYQNLCGCGRGEASHCFVQLFHQALLWPQLVTQSRVYVLRMQGQRGHLSSGWIEIC